MVVQQLNQHKIQVCLGYQTMDMQVVLLMVVDPVVRVVVVVPEVLLIQLVVMKELLVDLVDQLWDHYQHLRLLHSLKLQELEQIQAMLK
jgi:hypothetical protein